MLTYHRRATRAEIQVISPVSAGADSERFLEGMRGCECCKMERKARNDPVEFSEEQGIGRLECWCGDETVHLPH